MKVFILIAICLCAVGCSENLNQTEEAAAETETQNLGITEGIITLSPVHKFTSIPFKVEANGDGKQIIFTDLLTESAEDYLKFSFSFEKFKDDFEPEIFVVLITENNYFLIDYNKESRQILFTPASQEGNNAALSMNKYEITEGNAMKGKIELEFPRTMYSLYDLKGVSGKVYLFALDSGNEEAFQDDLFEAASNVLESKFK